MFYLFDVAKVVIFLPFTKCFCNYFCFHHFFSFYLINIGTKKRCALSFDAVVLGGGCLMGRASTPADRHTLARFGVCARINLLSRAYIRA